MFGDITKERVWVLSLLVLIVWVAPGWVSAKRLAKAKISKSMKKQIKGLKAQGYTVFYSDRHYEAHFGTKPKNNPLVVERLQRNKRKKEASESGKMRLLTLPDDKRLTLFDNETPHQRSLRHFFNNKGLDASQIVEFPILETEEDVTSESAEKVRIHYYDIVKIKYLRPRTVRERSGITMIEMANGMKYRVEGNQKIVQVWGGGVFRPKNFVLAKNLPDLAANKKDQPNKKASENHK